MSNALSQRRHERHPAGLLVVIGLHVLLALAMLYARLEVDSPAASQVPLTQVAPTDARPARPHDLPGAPRKALRAIVVPVPLVVVDNPEAVQATTQESPSVPGPAVTATQVPTPGPASPTAVGQGDGTQGGGTGRTAPRPARVYVDAPQCQPLYPEAARRMHVAGTTRLRFTVDAGGRVVDVRVLRSSGQMPQNFLLDRTASEALSHCPAAFGIDESGHPAGGTADIDYIWQLIE